MISAGSFNVRIGGGSNVNGATRTTSGSYTDFLTAVSGNNKLILLAANSTFVGSIDNVSLKQVRGQYIGPELITNGDYETGDLTGWNVSAGGQTVEVATNAAGSNALHIVTDGTNCNANQTITSLSSGEVARLTFDYEKVSANVAVNINGVDTVYSASGSYTQFFVSDGNDALAFKRSGAGEFFVDNVSVKLVGAAAVMTNMDPASDIVTDTPY